MPSEDSSIIDASVDKVEGVEKLLEKGSSANTFGMKVNIIIVSDVIKILIFILYSLFFTRDTVALATISPLEFSSFLMLSLSMLTILGLFANTFRKLT